MLGDVPRSEADIRSAVGRLENPASRIADRLFWLHSLSGTTNSFRNDHDVAFRMMIEVFADQLTEDGIWLWAKALRAWHDVINDDQYWLRISELEIEGGFEPPAFPSEMEELRSKAVEIAAQPLVAGARDALLRGDYTVVQTAMFALEQMSDTGSWVSEALKGIATTPIERFKRICAEVEKDFEQRIIRQPDVVKQNLEPCRAQLARFRSEVEPELSKLNKILPPSYEGVQDSREVAAILLSTIACNFTWADEFIESERLYEEALRLAQNTLGAIRIQVRLEEIRKSAQQQRVFGKPINSTPALTTYNGIGFTLYGCTDVDPETKSYTTTHYFTIFFIPIFPISRYRVIAAGERSWRFLGKLPLSRNNRWHLGVSLSAVCLAVIWMIAGSDSSSSSYLPVPPSGYTPVSAPSATSASAYRSTTSDTAQSGNDSQLDSLRSRIEAGRAQIKELENRLQPVVDKISSIDAQMKPLKDQLDNLKRENAEGIEVDTDSAFCRIAIGVIPEPAPEQFLQLRQWAKFASADLERLVDRCLKPRNSPAAILTTSDLRKALSGDVGAASTTKPLPSSEERGLGKVAGMHALKELLRQEVVEPVRNPQPYKQYGLSIPNGILLYGPPGCGKTYIARHLAEELNHYYVEIIPSELASPFIHQSVIRIREMFDLAAENAPSVVFIDEFEALVPSREDLGGNQQYKSEEVNEFLAHLNKCAERGIFLIAATNQPQKIDPAVRRTGRLDKLIYVGPPDLPARKEMLSFYLRNRPVGSDLAIDLLAESLAGYSASDLQFLVDEAARGALKKRAPISMESFVDAMERIQASVPAEVEARYQSIEQRGL